MNAKEFQLDYFQIYDLEVPKDVRELSPPVMLKGQFDQESEWAKPQFLKKFANPVSKNDEAIFDKNAHLTWYSLYSYDPTIRRNVKVANQFGEQEIVIYGVVGLLVPARKRKPRSVFSDPTKLDHYKIYRVIDGQGVGESFRFEDQFHAREAKVYNPVAFAVPVSKEHHGRVFPIHNTNAHLTIYKVKPSKDMPDVIDAHDQFGLHRALKMGVSYLLAVPSKKTEK
ncbi:MAG: hypothetical protein WAV32_00365 [Halobacteriota archaeon]